MNPVAVQRDLVGMLKKESYFNFELLNRVQPMSASLTKQLFKENALDKLSKNLFHHLTQYLVCVVDSQVAASLPWPIYDTAMERDYRNKLASFINDYSSKGLLSPVMSSYLVNPACYKVTLFLSELSQLAVQKQLQSRMKEHQWKSYDEITNKYKTDNQDFIIDIDCETGRIHNKVHYYVNKRKAFEKIAEMMRNQIKRMEDTLTKVNAQEYINNIVDGFINTHILDEETKKEVLKIKEIHETSKIFDCWLNEFDNQVAQMEETWDAKVTPFLETCKITEQNTETLMARHYNRVDRSTYMITYNHKTDYINTKDLQDAVNSQQKYILMNIVRDEKLNFPNLIRGFLVATSYIMRGAQTGNIYKFNERLEHGQRRYRELVANMRCVLGKIAKMDRRIRPVPPISFEQWQAFYVTFPEGYWHEVPQPLPDWREFPMTDQQRQEIYDAFTPLNTRQCNVQFNLRRQNSTSNFARPPNPAPYYQGVRDDFFRTSVSSNSYERHSSTQANFTIIPETGKINRTFGETTGFSNSQLQRLLSTKTTTVKKVIKKKDLRYSISVKKTRLFNESSTENRLCRSVSSPNLVESKGDKKRLSIVPDDSLPCLELSGIMALDNEISYETPRAVKADNTEKSDKARLPTSKLAHVRFEDNIAELGSSNTSSPQESINEAPKMVYFENNSTEVHRKSSESKMETPKMQGTHTVQKTNSLEKIINRYKKVRANIVAERKDDIVEENLNCSIVNMGIDNASLPDLVSPGYNGHVKKQIELEDFLDLDDNTRLPRASLGTVLGVDETFLDQFDLID